MKSLTAKILWLFFIVLGLVAIISQNMPFDGPSGGSGVTNTVTYYGAVPNMVKRFDGVCNSSTTFTSALGTFSSSDTGKYMEIVGCNANGATWHGTITYVSPTQVTLSVAATASATALRYAYGTPAQAAFQACADGVGAYGFCQVPAPTSCPTNAICGYILNVTDQMTAHAPGSVKIRFPGILFAGVGPSRVQIACSGWPALYTGSVSQGGSASLIRGNCIGVGDQDGPLGTAGENTPNVTVANLALDGMTTGNTFQGSFTPSAPTCSTTYDCWDITHKGISMPYGSSNTYNVTWENLWARYFKGEVLFGGGDAGKVRIKNVDIGDSNADAVSLSSDDFELTNSYISNTWNAGVENGIFAATKRHLYADNFFYNMWGQGIALPGVESTANVGPLKISRNTFNTIGSQSAHNSSTALSAIYTVGQIGTCGGSNCAAPSNLIAEHNTCIDCFIFATPITSGHTEFNDNSFGVDAAGLYNVFNLPNPMTDVSFTDNHGFVTANAIANSKSLVTVYLLNPGFGTLAWTGMLFSNNHWNFTGSSTANYTFTISSGSGFSAVTNNYPIFQGELCLGCTYPDTDNGQQNLATSATIKPVGPEIHVFDASPVTATIDASKSQDGSYVKIVNTGSTTVTFSADSNMDLSASVALAANQSAIFIYEGSLSKWALTSR